MPRQIKIYGERNTGTNYLSRLIALNLEAEELPGVAPGILRAARRTLPGGEFMVDTYFALTQGKNLGWKHTRVPGAGELRARTPDLDDIAIVTITKNPYSWLLSLFRNPYHARFSASPDFETFLCSPWTTTRRDNTDRVLASPVDLWNQKNRSYIDIAPLRPLNVTTEALLYDPEEILNRMCRHFGLVRRPGPFRQFQPSTKDAGKDGDYYRDYYLNEKWKAELSAKATATINKAVDDALMAHFGYRRL